MRNSGSRCVSAFTAEVQGREGSQLFVGGWRQMEREPFIIFKNYVCMINVSMFVYMCVWCMDMCVQVCALYTFPEVRGAQ